MKPSIDILTKRYYNKSTLKLSSKTRGCTGFDGGFEIMEAIRGLGPR